MSNPAAGPITDTTNSIHDAVTEESEESVLRVTYAGAKRRIAALEQQLVALQEVGTKRKS
jgi:hypothetical protein